MGEANIVAFDTALRLRGVQGGRVITEAELARRQRSVPLEDCHAALERVTVEIALKTRRFSLFHDLSAVFPKGRRIGVLGHKGSGKSTLFDLILKKRMPSRGMVLRASRLSFPLHRSDFIDNRLSLRDSIIFVSRVLGVDATRLVVAVQRFSDLTEKQMRAKVKELPSVARRRAGLVVALAADFDCHLIDGALNMRHLEAEGAEAEAIERAVFGRDYIIATSVIKQLPGNCDLAYILYDGRLYYFDDIQTATDIFTALPVPVDPGAGNRRKREDEDDDELAEETVF